MHSALFVVSIPEDKRKWGLFLQYADAKIAASKDALRLGPNVWLVNLQKSVAPLGHLIAIAEQQGELYGILPFEHAPAWLPGNFDPTAIQGLLAP